MLDKRSVLETIANKRAPAETFFPELTIINLSGGFFAFEKSAGSAVIASPASRAFFSAQKQTPCLREQTGGL
ncbi:MAG: hypothetical protein ACTH8C_12290, partial [Pseudomonas taetrolens]|uniref:hypothetical protein n=1 Tax=Pseudomonas taetrolens TaxID=47884 RepID=UPI003F9EB2C1